MAVLVIMTVALAGCGVGGEEVPPGVIVVRAMDFSFDPAELTIQAGQEVTILFRSSTALTWRVHNWVVLGAEEQIFTGKLLRGEEESVTFTIDQPGTYTFICDVVGVTNHRERGMEGTLIVQ